MKWAAILFAGQLFAILAISAEPPPRTSLSDDSLRFTVPEKAYVVLKRGEVEAVVVDNRAVDDTVLPGHRAGYSGLASLKHTRQPRNLFVPSYAGLNFEHIIDGTAQERAILFEPRNAPMQLRVIDEHTVELYQAATPHYGVESCQRFELRADGVIEMTFECIPRRKTWAHDYLLFFWASYIDQPNSLDIHFIGKHGGDGEPQWIRGVTPKHGIEATHLALDDHRESAHVEPFPLELPFGISKHRYTEPWYFGACRGMAFAQIFRAEDNVRLTQSPSGGGEGCPAWDFQWLVPDCKVGQRYQLVMRAHYTAWPDGADEATAREQLRQRAKELAVFRTAGSPEDEAVSRRAFGGVQPVISPDGKSIALSFQGCIARMPAEGGTLTRLTRGAGWDIEPTWSPDSKHIAFINAEGFYSGKLRLIAAEDGVPVKLPKEVAVSGKMRFHPDGRRILGRFSETGYPGALHWFDLTNGSSTPLVIDSLDSQHEGSMTWTLSPDGEEMLFTKNAHVEGEQTGTQGPYTELFRVSAKGGTPRLATFWPARVHGLCWGPDADTCYLVSNRGHVMHDIWRMPLGEKWAGARRLTSGQTDEDWPSVDASGRWLVHTDNSERATALTRVELKTGRRESLNIDRVDFREPTGWLRLDVRDAATGLPSAARLSVTGSGGKFHFPPGALYRLFAGQGTFYASEALVEAPTGVCEIRGSRGLEYQPANARVELAAGETRVVTLRLERWVDMPSRGWYSGENHIHANYGYGAWHCDPGTVRDQCEGEDLHVGNIVVANSDGDGVYDRDFFLGRPDPLSRPRTILYWNEEFRSTIWGHLTLGNLSQLVEPIFTGFKDTTNPWDVPTNADIAERTRAQGGTVSYTHPASNMLLDLYNGAYAGKGLPVDAALGRVDTMDVMGPRHDECVRLWYHLLNCGLRIPGAAGTDVFLNRIVSAPPGWGRAYVHLPEGLNYAAWIRGQRAGRSFVTSGPMLEMTAAQSMPGDTLKLDAPGEVQLRARAWSQHRFDALEIVVNGQVVQSIKPAEGATEAIFDGAVPITRSGWLAARCVGEDRHAKAHMNPIWVEVRGQPIDAREDARYLLKWIDRLEAELRRRDRLPGHALEHAMNQLETAREFYRKLVPQ